MPHPIYEPVLGSYLLDYIVPRPLSEDECRLLAAELGMPGDAKLFQLFIPERPLGEAWKAKGYHIKIIGILLPETQIPMESEWEQGTSSPIVLVESDEPDSELTLEFEPTDNPFPYLWLHANQKAPWLPLLLGTDAMPSPDETGSVSRVVQIWVMAVFFEESPVFIEARWHPDYGRTESIHGLEFSERIGIDSQIALRGLKLLRKHVRIGRPRNTGAFQSVEEFEALVIQSLEELIDAGHPTTQVEVAEILSRDPKTIRRYLTNSGLRWSDLIRRARNNVKREAHQ